MELVTSLAVFGGRLSAIATDSGGNLISLEGRELLKRGLPTTKSRHVQVTTDVTTWQSTTLDEYAFALGHPHVSACSGHACWSFIEAGKRYVVPALVLLRAIVRGNPTLLEKLMQPQSLDDLCRAAPDKETVDLLQSGWQSGLCSRTQASVGMMLRWLYAYPSARRFWASAYQFALDGRLDFKLPKARFSFTAAVKMKGANQYVHLLVLHSIEALEEAFPFGQSQPAVADVQSARSREANFFASPKCLTADISPVQVSDELWALLKPELVPANLVKKSVHRKHLDCVLTSVYCCTTLKHATELCGLPYTNVATALFFWRRDGRWDRVLQLVRQHIPARTPSAEERDTKFFRGSSRLASTRRLLMKA